MLHSHNHLRWDVKLLAEQAAVWVRQGREGHGWFAVGMSYYLQGLEFRLGQRSASKWGMSERSGA